MPEARRSRSAATSTAADTDGSTEALVVAAVPNPAVRRSNAASATPTGAWAPDRLAPRAALASIMRRSFLAKLTSCHASQMSFCLSKGRLQTTGKGRISQKHLLAIYLALLSQSSGWEARGQPNISMCRELLIDYHRPVRFILVQSPVIHTDYPAAIPRCRSRPRACARLVRA